MLVARCKAVRPGRSDAAHRAAGAGWLLERGAIDRMIENARLLGDHAVIAMRFDSSEKGQQLTDIVTYRTAGHPTGWPVVP